jgi:putative oxidoreductase
MTPGDLGLLILRLVIGLTFAAHGAQKAFGWWSGPKYVGWRAGVEHMGLRPPGFWALVSTAAELGGGVLLAVGLVTPLATAALIAQSVVIVGLVHLPKGFWNSKGGIEFPLSLAAGVVALAGMRPWGCPTRRKFAVCSSRSGSSAPSSRSRFRAYGLWSVRRRGHASATHAGGRPDTRSRFSVLVPGFSLVGGAGVDSRGSSYKSARVTLEGLCPGLTLRPSRIPGSGRCSARTGSRNSPG